MLEGSHPHPNKVKSPNSCNTTKCHRDNAECATCLPIHRNLALPTCKPSMLIPRQTFTRAQSPRVGRRMRHHCVGRVKGARLH